MLTLLSAFGFSGQIIATGYYMSKADAYCFNTVQMVTAGVLGMLVALLLEGLQPLSLQSGLSVLYLGVFSTCVAFLLQSIAQKYTTETKVGLILSTESVFGALLSVIILHEAVTWRLVLGGLLMFVAMILVESNPLQMKSVFSKLGLKKVVAVLDEEPISESL
ncbi:MAG TPA: hypothetical protein DCY20_03715 [Firmicutes bacterium]|nr:hypothetical protein [Bacillota bacterium]